MMVSSRALGALLLSANFANGFAPSRRSSPFVDRSGGGAVRMAATVGGGGGEFDHILGEGMSQRTGGGGSGGGTARRSILRVPDGSAAVTLTSSVAADATTAASPTDDEFFDAKESIGGGVGDSFVESNGIGERTFDDIEAGDPRVQELVRQKEKRIELGRFKSFEPMKIIEGKDFTDLLLTVIVPLGFGLYGARWAYGKSTTYLGETAEDKLIDYANEMVYHDGDFEEMSMCHSDYSKKLSWLGPSRKDRMIKTYLELFAKKVTVSPRSISSLSYVFSLYKLSEEKAAKTLTETCLEIPEKTASTQKLLFFGEHILKTPEAREKLGPIKEMLTASYREDVGLDPEDILDKSQKAMGEAAYRSAVTASGKKQKKLTPGWEVLGLDKETATTIFDEEKELGFVSSKEVKYSRAKLKYDSKGRRLDEDGKAEPGQEGFDDDDEDEDEDGGEPTANVYECGECGYTLFVAEGRDHKFFGAGFQCPECGAAKDKFVGRTAGGD